MEKNFTNYTTDDFIADESFQQWAASPNAESNAFWKQWINMHPEKQDEINLALSFIHHLQIKVTLPTQEEAEKSLINNLATIAAYAAAKESPNKRGILKGLRSYAVAAVVATLITGTIIFFLLQQNQVTMELATGPNEIKTFVLPDSSVVVLNANSSITYSINLQSSMTREVWLKGEAFFNIKRIGSFQHPQHRFIVHTGDLNVEVLGTTFNIRKIDAFTNVSLNTGKIKINLEDHPETSLLLQPGDFIQYSSKQKHIIKKQVKAEMYSVWKTEKLTLDKVPLSEIATLIQDTYGYKVSISNKQLANSEISGTLLLKDENTLLETLEFALDITILKKDSVLIFQQIPISKKH